MLDGHGKRKPLDDMRKEYVAIGCGHCVECKKQKAREWQIRLCEEIKVHKYNYFVTLTFNEESLRRLINENPKLQHNVNYIAGKAVRRFLERWRKKHKKSVKHWLITELGHNGTERIHLHGLIMLDKTMTNEELENIWQYGHTYTGDYCNEKTINYIIKYVTKIDTDHKGYEADIFCSAGIGKSYTENEQNKFKHRFNGKNTIQYYTLKDGSKIALPTYYRNKFWTQQQRDELWTHLLNSDTTYVRGIRVQNISTPKGYNEYKNILSSQQKINNEIGYGNTAKEWDEKIYKVTFDMLHGKK